MNELEKMPERPVRKIVPKEFEITCPFCLNDSEESINIDKTEWKEYSMQLESLCYQRSEKIKELEEENKNIIYIATKAKYYLNGMHDNRFEPDKIHCQHRMVEKLYQESFLSTQQKGQHNES